MKNSRMLLRCAMFTALTALGAFLKIPFALSAITLQFFFAAMAGLLLGPGWGALSQALYVLLGLVGLPLFASGGGIGYVLYPSFGFAAGLIPAAWLIGCLTKTKQDRRRIVFSCLAGLGLLYGIGLPYMALSLCVFRGDSIKFSALLIGGMLVYLPGDALKILVCTLLGPRLMHLFPRL